MRNIALDSGPNGQGALMEGLEFIFFNKALAERFRHFVSNLGIASQVRKDEMEGVIVELADEIEDEMSDAIDVEYDSLMKEQMVLAETDGGG
ncbi:MAG: hypothetical protein KGI82_00030 [Betaproteobacteria bacterium]|nr:hypothetical protein [Betaproteobacteria bacterium]